eukprot:m.96495 g.96495  ORF g.96495 m.96495 type:complete len:385 (+) comp13548_c0_seq8:271-1425(+)
MDEFGNVGIWVSLHKGVADSELDTFMHGVVGLLAVVIPGALIALFVGQQNKFVAAFAQAGGLQEREAAREALLGSTEKTPGKSDIRPLSPLSEKKEEKRNMRLYDKLAFTFGTMNVMLTCFIVGASPTSYHLYYTPTAIILIFMRWRQFKKEKKQNLLYDFCYWANFICLYFVWFSPQNPELFQIIFMCANGPLAWSVLAFNQSLIFHSWQHITSLVIHISPMLLTYGLRWFPDDRFKVCGDEGCDIPGKILVWNALFKFYIFWIVGYYCWVFIVLGTYIKEQGFQTLYDRVALKKPVSYMLQAVDRVHKSRSGLELVKKTVYIFVHVVLSVLTMSIAVFFWENQLAHFVFIAAILTASAWNGAGFYFQVFSRNYEEHLDKKVS